MKETRIPPDFMLTDKDGNTYVVQPVQAKPKEKTDMSSLYKKLVENMKNIREEKGITQQDIAEYSGISKNYVSAVERGVNKCSAEVLLSYAKILGVPVSTLVGDIGDDLDPELRMMLAGLSKENLETVKTLTSHLYKMQLLSNKESTP